MFLAALSSFALFITIGLAFWIGELTGKIHLGFVIVASFYLLLGIVFMIIHKSLIFKIKNYFIHQLLN